MLVQVVLPVELPVAMFARDRLLARVDHLVPRQVLLPCKRLRTLVALVRSFIVVAQDVSLQVLVSRKSRPADAAEEPSLRRVHLVAVSLQPLVTGEGLLAEATLVALRRHSRRVV